MEVGKKVYRSTSIPSIKVMSIITILVLFYNLYLQTFNDPEFSLIAEPRLRDVIQFHFKYPYDLLSYIFFILLPCLYYGFIRSVIFFEGAILVNKGLPFFNRLIFYGDIKSYEIIHSKLFMSLKYGEKSSEIFFAIRNVDRAVSLFDQHNVEGDLKSKVRLPVNMNSKITMLIIIIAIAVGVGQSSLWLSRFLFR